MESAVNFFIGFAEASLALVILLYLRRLWRSFPWLAALALFFVLRGIDRIYVGALGKEPPVAPIITDGFLLVAVVLLLLGVRKTLSEIRRSIDAAEWQKSEYERALSDYRALVRHRLANPLTIVLAGVETLRLTGEKTREERVILDSVYEGIQRLRRISLEAAPISAEEESLEPRPRIPP